MKQLRNIVQRVSVNWALLLAAILISGCGTDGYRYDPLPNGEGGVAAPSETFRKGELVVISFASPGLPKPDHEERVKDDGTITPPDIGTVTALNKTPGQLQKELQAKYNELFNNLTVTVKPGDRYYYIDGEVKTPGPRLYLGETDVLGAISAAGGFTEFANRKKIRLIHPNGITDIVNYEKALEDPVQNLPVYPGDKIVVRRRLF